MLKKLTVLVAVLILSSCVSTSVGVQNKGNFIIGFSKKNLISPAYYVRLKKQSNGEYKFDRIDYKKVARNSLDEEVLIFDETLTRIQPDYSGKHISVSGDTFVCSNLGYMSDAHKKEPYDGCNSELVKRVRVTLENLVGVDVVMAVDIEKVLGIIDQLGLIKIIESYKPALAEGKKRNEGSATYLAKIEDELKTAARKLKASQDRPLLQTKGTKVCKDESNLRRVGFIEDFTDNKIKILTHSIYYRSNPDMKPSGFRQEVIWDYYENWTVCDN